MAQDNCSRREFICATGMAGLSLCLGRTSQAAVDDQPAGDQRPNIVFIFTDQQAFHEWSGAGNPDIYTPNLQRMARQGRVFDNCVSNNPICVPYRASLLTGKFGHQNGFRWNATTCGNTGKGGLQPEHQTWSQTLKDNGYTMGYIGKWHLYPGAECHTEKDGKTVSATQVPLKQRFGFTDYWRKTHDHMDVQATKYYDDQGKECTVAGYGPAGLMDMSLSFIEKHKDESRPFCLTLSWFPPHPPYGAAPQKWVEYYQDKTLSWRKNVPVDAIDDKLIRQAKGAYAHVSAMDEQLGRLLDKLHEWKMDNTILVFTSDHGDCLQSHRHINKRHPWDESIKVPFLISWPAKIPAGTRTDAVLSTIDIGPTLLGMAGINAPDQMQGQDLTHLVLNKPGPEPDSAFIMYHYPPGGNYYTKRHPDLPDYRGVRTKRYTYALRRNKPGEKGSGVKPWILFDNQEDPYQMNNLIDSAGHQELQAQLHQQVLRWLDMVGEEFV